MSSLSYIYMFTEVERKLDIINGSLAETNRLLAKIEENLRVPDMLTWTKILEELKKRS